jgi:hypothetical protein
VGDDGAVYLLLAHASGGQIIRVVPAQREDDKANEISRR